MTASAPFEALVLRSYETGNTSEVVQVLSAGRGRVSLYCRGARRKGNRYRAALQTLAHVEIVASGGRDHGMMTLREASCLDPPVNWETDLDRFALAMVLADVAAESCEEGQPVPELFSLLVATLAELRPGAGGDTPPLAVACVGLLHVLEAGGEAPVLAAELTRPWPSGKEKPRCFWLDTESGLIHAPASPEEDSPLHWRTPRLRGGMAAIPPAGVRLVHATRSEAESRPLDEGEGRALFEALLRFFEHHSGRALRSARFWRQMANLPS